MALAPFNEVYEAYHRIVCVENRLTMSGSRGLPYVEFDCHPLKLIQAYALAISAVQDGGVVRTPVWNRQTGASTFACALVATSRDVTVLQADTQAMRHATRRLLNAFPSELKSISGNGSPVAWYHDRVLSASTIDRRGLHGRVLPKLVVVDSEAAYMREREEAIERVASLGVAVLVLEGPTPPRFI